MTRRLEPRPVESRHQSYRLMKCGYLLTRSWIFKISTGCRAHLTTVSGTLLSKFQTRFVCSEEAPSEEQSCQGDSATETRELDTKTKGAYHSSRLVHWDCHRLHLTGTILSELQISDADEQNIHSLSMRNDFCSTSPSIAASCKDSFYILSSN